MHSPDLIETKLREADYLITRMRDAGFDIFAFYCDFSAFLASSRSVTFAMQAVMSKHPLWSDWYEDVKNRRLVTSRGKLMVHMRNVTQKVGDVGIVAGSGGPQRPVQHYFDRQLTAGLDEDDREADVLTVCERHMGDIVAVVQEWAIAFQDLWGLDSLTLSAEIDPDALGGWRSEVWVDEYDAEILLLTSPGEQPPDISDLVARYCPGSWAQA